MADEELYAIYSRRRAISSQGSGSAAFDVDRDEDPATKLSFQKLDAGQAAELSNSPDHELAPIMAASLIKPMSDRQSEEGDFWGIEAVGAQDCRWTGRGVKVAILDTGIDESHRAFAGVDITQQDFTGSGAEGDLNGHGTHCAGVFFGRDVDGQRIGVAPGVQSVLSARVLDAEGRGSTDGLLKGLRWAMEEGANVISVSLGLNYAGEVEERVRNGWPEALAASRALDAFRKNVAFLDVFMADVRARRSNSTDPLIVAAAGNESRLDLRSYYRMDCVVPAAVTEMSVGAVGLRGGALQIAPFSNGPATLVAPGMDIASAWPGGGLRTTNGTSAACPHVAGCAALWWHYGLEDEEGASGDFVRSHLISKARRAGFEGGWQRAAHGRGMASAPT